MRRACLAAAVVWISASCASAPIKKQDQASVADASGLVVQGCYDCLLEARAVYDRVAIGRARPLLVERLFEVNLLIALREGELAIDPAEAIGRAKKLVPELPATYPSAMYLEVAESIPPDHVGMPRAAMQTFLRAHDSARTKLPAWKAELGPNPSPLAQYLLAGLDCATMAYGRSGIDRGGLERLTAELDPASPPLVRYRRGTCPSIRASVLEAVLVDVPRFVEAGMFVSRLPSLVISPTFVANRRKWLGLAAQRFPRSPSVAYDMGTLHQTVGDCKAAVRSYEDAIALQPLHEDAAMQRVVCLGYLGLNIPAVEGATRIIEAKMYNVGDAWYWRAWNRHRRKELEMARADIEQARNYQNAKMFTLAGIIEYDQTDLVPARRDLNAALQMDPMQCVAHWYLALVMFPDNQWPNTAEQFGRSMNCYKRSADQNVSRLDAMRKADLDPDFKATQIAGFEAVIKEDRDQEYASALNAANSYARGAMPEKALEWLDKIPPTAMIFPKAEELRKLIKGAGGLLIREI